MSPIQQHIFALSVVLLSLLFVSTHVSAKSAPTVILDPGHGGNDQGGYDGKGFKLENGDRIPEDAYMYDIALRIDQILASQDILVIFTVVQKEVAIYSGHTILPPLHNLVYNFPKQNIRVHNGKEGVKKRLEVVQQLPVSVRNNAVYISLHFDYAPFVVSGARIFTARNSARHPFVKILETSFSSAGLSLHVRGEAKASITVNENLIVLKDGTIVPRVLIELGNWNDPRDRAFLLSPPSRERYAEIIARALKQYFDSMQK